MKEKAAPAKPLTTREILEPIVISTCLMACLICAIYFFRETLRAGEEKADEKWRIALTPILQASGLDKKSIAEVTPTIAAWNIENTVSRK